MHTNDKRIHQSESLQKLTDSSSDNMVKPLDDVEILEELNRKHPVKDNSSKEHNRCVNLVIQDALEHPSLSEINKRGLRSQLWERNHRVIITAVRNYMFEFNQMPTATELSGITGLSRETIYKHLGTFMKEASYHAQIEQFQMMREQVLVKMFKLAVSGDVRAAKIYLDTVGENGLNQSKMGKQTGESTNFIQVNSNIKIDQVTFTTLPEAVQHQIANLILQGLHTTPQVITSN